MTDVPPGDPSEDPREALIREQGLLVVGAEYSLETGEVDFFEGLPEVG